MKKAISEYTEIAQLRTIMDNAKRLNREDVWWQAFRRICTLEGMDYSDPLHRDFLRRSLLMKVF